MLLLKMVTTEKKEDKQTSLKKELWDDFLSFDFSTSIYLRDWFFCSILYFQGF